MLTEIENLLIKNLRENLPELPSENINVKAQSAKLPAVVLTNVKFKFENAGLAENIEQEKAALEESFSGDGTKKIFRLQEIPLKRSVTVSNLGVGPLAEMDDFTVDYSDGSVSFFKAPGKGKDNVVIKYNSRNRIMTSKIIRLKAFYLIEVLAKARLEADALAERVVKVLLNAEGILLDDGIEIKPLGGVLSAGEENIAKIQLKYVVRKEMRTEQVIGPMERIIITRKQA